MNTVPDLVRRRRGLAAIVAFGFLLVPLSLMAKSHLIFLGTYTRTTSRGIYAVRFDSDTGKLGEPFLVAESPNPGWLALSPDKKFLYAIHESPAQAVGFAVDAASGKLTPLPAEKSPTANAPSHLAVDATGRVLLAANYREGRAEAVPLRADGTLGQPVLVQHSGTGPNKARQEKSHVHSATPSPDNRFVIFCDLGVDKIFTYALDSGAGRLAPATPPFVATAPGAGPRHFKFSLDGRHAYAINELDNTIALYDYAAATGSLTPRQVVPTLPADFKGENTTAEVRVHPNGRFVYGSNRGHDSLAVFSVAPDSGQLTRVEIVPSGGKIPRNFALSPDGRWLICAHQDSNNLTVFRVDTSTGRLTRQPGEAAVPMCVCVLFYD
ncbi:MAG: lactonase family protein [Verrucomicrobia bacterium]|nr:lactonase family protein [Verrucomicrobiota bacterium]